MKINLDANNFIYNSYTNSLEKVNFFESPISSSRNYFLNNNNNNQIMSQQIENPYLKKEYLNNLLNETKVIQNDYNNKKSILMKESEEIQENKKK